MANHVAVVVDNMTIPARDIDRMFGGRSGIHGPRVRAHHIHTVEMRVCPILQ
ncbi:Uncharacterised protein [Mycobacteroides abscessus subsp. abscessus]|nr:Uncharacterised protein [Mycobacteroides abscessus subsp. abscessus]